MQTPEHTLDGHRLIVLDKGNIQAGFRHIPLAVGLHKVAPVIAMNGRGNNAKALDAAYIFLNCNLTHGYTSISFR